MQAAQQAEHRLHPLRGQRLYLGCYGDKNAHTPNLDRSPPRASATPTALPTPPSAPRPAAPSCSAPTPPAQAPTTCAATTKSPQHLTPFHHPLKKAGYFVTGVKGDYNNSTHLTKNLWDGHAGKGEHFKRRDKEALLCRLQHRTLPRITHLWHPPPQKAKWTTPSKTSSTTHHPPLPNRQPGHPRRLGKAFLGYRKHGRSHRPHPQATRKNRARQTTPSSSTSPTTAES